MLKWLIWAFWGPPEYVRGPIRALERRLEAYEDELKHVNRRLERLTGRLTGGLKGHARGSEDPEVDPSPSNLDELNELIRQGGRPSVRVPQNNR